jgi:serine/threonine protein phosphatase 1
MRRFVIGDIHGCSKALRTLVECIDPQPEDELIFLGDYVDRGPDSRGVIDLVIDLQGRCRVIPLRGNHEIMLCGVAFGGLNEELWLASGGKATVTSYGGSLKKIPQSHREFLQSLVPHHETEQEIFVHACYEAGKSMEEQSDEIRYWTHLGTAPPPPHFSGKRVFVGHTPQSSGYVYDLGHLVCVDTYCFGTGYLTALNVTNDEAIQVDKRGFRRRVPAEALLQLFTTTYHAVRSVVSRRKLGDATREEDGSPDSPDGPLGDDPA